MGERITRLLLYAAALALLAGCPETEPAKEPRWGERVLYHPPERASAVDPGWHSVYLPLAGEPEDPARLEVARTRLLDGVRMLRAAVGRGRIRPGAERVLDSLGWRTGGLDPADLYERLPDRDGDARSVVLHGRPDGEGYVVDLAPGMKDPGPRLGEAILSIRIVPAVWREERSFRLESDLEIDMGDVDGASGARALERLARRFAEPSAAGSQAHPVEGQALENLDRRDLSILGALQGSFPRTVERALNLYELHDLAAGPEESPHLHLVLGASARGFERHFPALARWLARLGDVLSVTASIPTPTPGVADGIVYRTEGSWLETAVHPRPEGELSPYDRRGLLSIDARASGLVAHVHDLPFDVSFRPGERSARLVIVLDRMPRSLGVEGKALGILDKNVIRALSGLDLDRILRDFLLALVRGNDGAGTRIAIDWRPEDGRNRLLVSVRTELLSNRAVSTGSRIASSLYGPDDEVLAQARGLADVLLEGLELDLAKFGER